MPLLAVSFAGLVLLAAYLTIGRALANRVFRLDPSAATPATTDADDRDYVPTRRSIVFGHHFTSIAGTGPIVGPAIAVMWGWLPATLWVVLGSIFIGAIHDLGSLVVSIRNRGRSLGDVAGDLIGPRARLLFLAILIIGLWIVLAVFGLVIAAVLKQYPQAVAPVLLQIPLAAAIGLVFHRRSRGIALPSAAALVLMYAAVVWGDAGPVHDFNVWMAGLPTWVWVAGLLAYAYVASVLPVWLLLQPRDYVNALQLLTSLGLLTAGLAAATVWGGPALGAAAGVAVDPTSVDAATRAVLEHREELRFVAPAFDPVPAGAPPLFPILFITVACGACSGFHCLVSSGTTSKQLARETDATPVAFGSMLVEAFLAVLVIAACAAGLGLGANLSVGHGWGAGSGPDADTVLHYSAGVVERPGGAPGIVVEHERLVTTPTGPDADRRAVTIGDTLRLYENAGDRFEGFGIRGGAATTTASISWRDDLAPAATHAAPPGQPALGRSLEHGSVLLAGEPADGPRVTGELAHANRYTSWSDAGSLGAKVSAFVDGGANFLGALGLPIAFATALIAVMVASFAATTMDTACRLQRYVIQELARALIRPKDFGANPCPTCGYDLTAHLEQEKGGTGVPPVRDQEDRRDACPTGEEFSGPVRCPECGEETDADRIARAGRPTATPSVRRSAASSLLLPFTTVHGATLAAVLSAGVLACFPAPGQGWSLDAAGSGGLILWPLFGATNQLLAGFAFVVIVAWLIATDRPRWFAFPAAAVMLVIPAAALVFQAFLGSAEHPSWLESGNWLLLAIAAAALGLQAWLLIETLIHLTRRPRPG